MYSRRRQLSLVAYSSLLALQFLFYAVSSLLNSKAASDQSQWLSHDPLTSRSSFNAAQRHAPLLLLKMTFSL